MFHENSTILSGRLTALGQLEQDVIDSTMPPSYKADGMLWSVAFQIQNCL
jgi:hypothetical protein